LLAFDDIGRDANAYRMKHEPEICKRVIAALEKWNDATPERLKELWELCDMRRPTSRQIASAAKLLVLAGEIEVLRIRIDGRTVTHYVRIRK
jgi:hypothetical protein